MYILGITPSRKLHPWGPLYSPAYYCFIPLIPYCLSASKISPVTVSGSKSKPYIAAVLQFSGATPQAASKAYPFTYRFSTHAWILCMSLNAYCLHSGQFTRTARIGLLCQWSHCIPSDSNGATCTELHGTPVHPLAANTALAWEYAAVLPCGWRNFPHWLLHSDSHRACSCQNT